jgi:hypothetical protein
MAKQTINIGTTANDRTGDPLRTAFSKTNANFTEVYDAIDAIAIPSDLSDLTDTTNSLFSKQYIELTNRIVSDANTIVSFTKPANTSSNTVFDDIDTDLILTRDATGIGGQGGGIYNKALESEWDQIESPLGTEWNLDGWDNLDDVKVRFYEPFREVFRNRIGNNIVGAKLVMHDTINDKYYKFEFTQWQQGADHDGSFAYTRELIDTSVSVGVEYPDGTLQVTSPKPFAGFREIFIGDTSQYDIQPKDSGKYINAFNTTIYVPDEETFEFSRGSYIFFTAGAGPITIEARDTAVIYGPDGILTSSWEIPPRTTATIIKTDTNTWNITANIASEAPAANTVSVDLSAVDQDIVPSTDSTYNLGSAENQWNSLYVSANTIFIGGTPVSVLDGTLTINGNPITAEADLAGTLIGDTYKGFSAIYGRIYDNPNSEQLSINKVVIYEDGINPTSTITQFGDDDGFEVGGISDSSTVAMFVLYSNTNLAKDFEDLKSFVRAAIDNVILNGGVQGNVNTIENMRSAFYTNISTLTNAANGLVETFDFYPPIQVTNPSLSGGSGTGASISELEINETTGEITRNFGSVGSGYQFGDVLTLLGDDIEGMSSPENDLTITVTQVSESGGITGLSIAGTLPFVWPAFGNIVDGGSGQYNVGNYINTNLAQEISYNAGEVVSNANTEFGDGSSYCALYSSSIFGIVATNSTANTVSTSGGLGSSGNYTTDTGILLRSDKNFDETLPSLVLTNKAFGIPVRFTKIDNGDQVDIFVEDVPQGSGIGITRGVNQGIYNPYQESGWDSSQSPVGTLWNTSGWDDLSDVTTRTYTDFFGAFGGALGNNVVGPEAILYIPSVEKYYAVKFTSWTQGGNGGGFSYVRYEIDTTQADEGIRFSDNTIQKTAYIKTNVKSTASRGRRIEEVYGSKTVELTSIANTTLTTTATKSVINSNLIWINENDPIVNILDTWDYDNDPALEFSLDEVTWYPTEFGGYNTGDPGERGYFLQNNPTLTYNQDDIIYFRYRSGGLPVVWWDKNDLPGGAANFRGAIIDYHVYTGESTIIGTIHIVDDDGEEHIAHTEVASGSTDGENDDLWVVRNEGTISYRRIDGESKTFRAHWSARVFYGEEFWD